ncbi:MAG TPA: NUDIX domain-containing protein [Nocardioidaceae bacterium]|nr:NUDIX domain-containing protein [Nocardioidaceae bacterium]
MAASNYICDLRRRIGQDLLLLPAVMAVVHDSAGRVLVQQRADDGSWELPGGLIDPGEQPAQALVREVREETGLLVRPTRVLSVETHPQHRYPHGDLIQCTVTVFAADVVTGELGGQDEEARGHMFVSTNELITLRVRGGHAVGAGVAFAWDERWLEQR